MNGPRRSIARRSRSAPWMTRDATCKRCASSGGEGK